MKFQWEMDKYLDLPEFYSQLIATTALQTQGPGCISPISGNATSLNATHLTVGQLPSVQQFPQIRDPEWLKVEVCREFQRGACKRTAEECRYAHPPKNIQVTPEGKVIACYDALKGKCSRETCKYLHPTYQIKQQLEITGRQTLIQNRAMLQQMLPIQQIHAPTMHQPGVLGYDHLANGTAPHLTGSLYNPTAAAPPGSPTAAYNLLQPTEITALSPHMMPYYQLTTTAQPHTQVAAMLPAPGGMRADKLEVCRDFLRGNCTRGEYECRYGHPLDRGLIDMSDNTVTVCMDYIKGRCAREKCKYFHPPSHLQAKIRAAQNQASHFGNPVNHAPMGAPQPAIMMSNGSPGLGQPALKRHALDNTLITSTGNAISSTHGATSSSSTPPNGLTAALCGYTSATLPLLTSPHHQTLPPVPAYYQQALPMLHVQYGGAAGGLPATPVPTSNLAAFNFSTSTSNNIAANPAFAYLNGANQLAGDIPQQSLPGPPNSSNTLTVCRDFQSGKCTRPFCRFVHIEKDYVEVKDDKVTICLNALQGNCDLPKCKFYHYPSVSMPSFVATNLFNPIGEESLTSGLSNQGNHGLLGLLQSRPMSVVP